MKVLFICTALILLAGCTVMGKENVGIAPYSVVQKSENKTIEIRHYDRLVLVSTPMDSGKNSSFRTLFRYISGDNVNQSNIAMTAPVFMDEASKDKGVKIPMTAPVFMNEEKEGGFMSFVMPDNYTIETTPKPINPNVKLQELTDYTVATITFSGTLNQKNINKHKDILTQWIEKNGYKQTGYYKAAGYNSPFTLPFFRRNEVLIPIKYDD